MDTPRETPPPLPLVVVTAEAGSPPPAGEARPADPTLFHPWSATLLLAVDNLWALPDFSVIAWFITVPLAFLSVFAGTFLIQRRHARDRLGPALAKAVFLGAVAAVPTSVTGTPVGLALLAWAGIRHPWKRGV